MSYWCLDDFTVGRKVETVPVKLEAEEIMWFARQYDPQPFHTDPEAAKDSVFGGLISSGFQTVAVATGQFLRTGILDGSNLGGARTGQNSLGRAGSPGGHFVDGVRGCRSAGIQVQSRAGHCAVGLHREHRSRRRGDLRDCRHGTRTRHCGCMIDWTSVINDGTSSLR